MKQHVNIFKHLLHCYKNEKHLQQHNNNSNYQLSMCNMSASMSHHRLVFLHHMDNGWIAISSWVFIPLLESAFHLAMTMTFDL